MKNLLDWLKNLRKPLPLGARAERAAAKMLRRTGYRVLSRNLRTRMGEIDIIAEDRRTGAVVVVEVKSASSDHPGPEIHMTRAKMRKLTVLADHLVKRYRLQDHSIRFDVVAIVWPHDAAKPTRMTHHVNAFYATH